MRRVHVGANHGLCPLSLSISLSLSLSFSHTNLSKIDARVEGPGLLIDHSRDPLLHLPSPGFGFRALGFGLWVLSFEFPVLGFGFPVLGFGFRVPPATAASFLPALHNAEIQR